eukprot:GHRR01013181.1.p1 GENE.GHRR01013181.1~~GHRR01013181.1.p1  ORF type:complete len:481 (+),score=214.80 GHRR01013181.1:219-1661(+)
MAELGDVEALQQQLQALKEQRERAREKLDALRGGRGRGRGLPGVGGGRGRSDLHQCLGPFNRLGPIDGPGLRVDEAGPPSSRPSVFDRLYDRAGHASTLNRQHHSADELHRSDSWHAARNDLARDASTTAAPSSNGEQPFIMRKLSSRVVAAGDAGGLDNDSYPNHEQQPQQPQQPGAAAPGGGRKRLLSAVVVNGEARTVQPQPVDVQQEPAVEEPPPKRPATRTDDKTKRRAQRMFGALLVGTLQKFKDEDAAFRSSTTAQKRQELERRAAEKAEAEDRKRREEAAAARRQEKEAQISSLMDLNLQAEIKHLEIIFAKRIQYKQKLLGFCVTKTQPPLYWLPKQQSEECQALLQEHAAAFEEWKQQQIQQLEVDKAELAENAAVRRQQALTRRQQQQQDGQDGAAGAGNASELPDGDDAEHGDAIGDDAKQHDDTVAPEQMEEDNAAAAGDEAEEEAAAACEYTATAAVALSCAVRVY